MNLAGKAEAMKFLQEQEEQAKAVQQQQQDLAHAFEDAKLKEMYSKTAAQLATAKERYGRFQSDIGLLEERMSEVSKNRALSTKAKMEALEKMVDVIGKYGEIEAALKLNQIESFDYASSYHEDLEKHQAYKEAADNEFASKILNGMGQQAM